MKLYDRFYDDIYSYVYRRADLNHVDDIVANTFMTAWRRIDRVPDDKEALYWLYRVAYGMLSNHWRGDSRQQRLRTKLEGLGRAVQSVPEDYVVQDEESRGVIEAASRLKPLEREVLLLSVWEQLSQAEIAEVLETTSGAVKQRLYRARKSFTKEYNRQLKKSKLIPIAREGGMR